VVIAGSFPDHFVDVGGCAVRSGSAKRELGATLGEIRLGVRHAYREYTRILIQA
jgi:hypothetical protein